MSQRLSAPGAAFLRHHEGFVDHWYLDPVNVPTIGVGFTWASSSFRDWWGRNKPGVAFAKGAKITRAEADAALVFMSDAEYGKAVSRFYGRDVAQHVFDGTTSPVFNLGPGSLEWKWAAAAKGGDIKRAADLLRTTGTTAKGKKLRGLEIRRKEEAELLEHGDYTIGTNVVYADPMTDGILVRGERGSPVYDLQAKLAALGFYTGTLDGNFGYGTEAAVMAFQRSKRLKADGWAGPKTLDALDAPIAPPKLQSAPPPDDIDHYPEEPLPQTPAESTARVLPKALIGFVIIAALTAAAWFVFNANIIPS